MQSKKCFSFLLLACAILLCGASVANACSCVGSPTVLDAYDYADIVVITRAVSVEKADKDERYAVDGVRSTRMVVEEVFKGCVKVGDEMTFGQGGGADCIWTFNEQSLGKRYLFYLNSPQESREIWFAGGCGRSTGVDNATDDLLYLNRLDEVRGKTRISGMVEFLGDSNLGVGGRVIRISGANKVHTIKTNRKGVYEIYDLPPGRYLLEAETPTGWRAESYFLPTSYTSNFDGRGEEQSPKKFLIILEDKKHVGFVVRFEKDNTVRDKH